MMDRGALSVAETEPTAKEETKGEGGREKTCAVSLGLFAQRSFGPQFTSRRAQVTVPLNVYVTSTVSVPV